MSTNNSTAVALRREFAAVTIPDLQQRINAIKHDLADAADMQICSAEMATEALDICTRIAGVHDELDAERKALTAPLRDGTAWINDGFRGALENMSGAVDQVKAKLKDWNRVVAEKARLAKVEADKVARLKQAEFEAAAEKQREAARQQQVQAEALAAAGKEEEAADLFSKAADTFEAARDTVAIGQSVVALPVAAALAPVKGSKKTWKCRVTDKAKLVLICANRLELLSLIDFNESNLAALAKTNQGNVEIPGLLFYEEDSVSIRRN